MAPRKRRGRESTCKKEESKRNSVAQLDGAGPSAGLSLGECAREASVGSSLRCCFPGENFLTALGLILGLMAPNAFIPYCTASN